ncbi:MAG: ACT domain-containing protein [Oscillospiraceae bacterium]|nr:ACT domain-containing protein [Oscillospiraceae bacterium]
MHINQISVFVENRTGRLYEITDILARNNINIRALSIADTTDFGILRLIVNEPEQCRAALKDAGVTTKMTEVLAAQLNDKPGALSELLGTLRAENIDVEYIYAFVSRADSGAYVVLRVEDIAAASKTLLNAGVNLLGPNDVRGV